VLHALALLVALEGGLGGRGLLAIEEPENALHPWSLRAMVQRAQRAGARQLLLTTHSETVVSSVEDPAALYVVENMDGSGTVLTPATDRETALATILKESGEKLGDIWIAGTLGGVPGSQP
jgi:predicted ATPase